MSVYRLPYISFVDGASRNNQNLESASWEIYAPTDELICLLSPKIKPSFGRFLWWIAWLLVVASIHF
jgi:hypothetical protein